MEGSGSLGLEVWVVQVDAIRVLPVEGENVWEHGPQLAAPSLLRLRASALSSIQFLNYSISALAPGFLASELEG